jgi:hypothetical protein
MLYGPDGKMIQKDDYVTGPSRVDVRKEFGVNPGMLETQTGRGIVTRELLAHRMHVAKITARAYEAVMNGRAHLADADEYGDREIIFNDGTASMVKVGEEYCKKHFGHVKDWNRDKEEAEDGCF